jgi:hypothetical protein
MKRKGWFRVPEVPVQDWVAHHHGPLIQECLVEQSAYIFSQEAEKD